MFNLEVSLIRDQVWINVGAYDSKFLNQIMLHYHYRLLAIALKLSLL